MKTSLYDEIVWLLENVDSYGGGYSKYLAGHADDALLDRLHDYSQRRAEVLRLLKNEPKK